MIKCCWRFFSYCRVNESSAMYSSMTYLLKDVEYSGVRLLERRGKELEPRSAVNFKVSEKPLGYTFCCASGLYEDTPRTSGVDRGRETRGEMGGRALARERRARRPQRKRDMIASKIHSTHWIGKR